MLTIISHSLFFFLIIYANGFFFCKKFLKVEKKVDIYEVSLIGLISTIFIAQFINFFSPLSDVWILLNFLFSLIVIYYYRDFIFKKKKVKLKYLSIFFVLIIAQIYGSNFSDDIDHYHYSYILNSDKFNYIIGNSYLHHLYGTSPIWLVAHSFFNFDYTSLILFDGM